MEKPDSISDLSNYKTHTIYWLLSVGKQTSKTFYRSSNDAFDWHLKLYALNINGGGIIWNFNQGTIMKVENAILLLLEKAEIWIYDLSSLGGNKQEVK